MTQVLAEASELSDARNNRQVGWWLMAVAVLVVIMVVVGGATRLTDSGLSITEWRPVTGAVPPLSQEQWLVEFEKYQQIPEYTLINKGMSLGEFKSIYYWEWGHRFLGRLIGFAFLIPFVYFLLARKIEKSLAPKLVGLFVLGGSQGFLGWYMVQSGLVDRVDVSHLRLAAHLGLAFLILAALFWVALGLLRESREPLSPQHKKFQTASTFLVGFIGLQIILGALVAGLHAGRIYNTWPLMDGALIPTGLFMQSPWYANFIDSHLTVQFNHRLVAYCIALLVVLIFVWSKSLNLSKPSRQAISILAFIVGIQVLLGIWTLLAVVPISLGLLHQLGAALSLLAALNLVHTLGKPAGDS